MDTVDVVVAGAGVVGIAIARALAQDGRQVLVLEAEAGIGTHTSSRNSEVIHAGLYYPKHSLKARLCVRGRDMLYRYCAERGVPHRCTGKLVIASDESELPRLEALRESAAANGVPLQVLTAAETNALEPEIVAVRALWSQNTGIVDSHALMLSLQGDAERDGAVFVFNTPVTGGALNADGVVLRTGGSDPAELHCRLFVNAAGMGAAGLEAAVQGLPAPPRGWLAKGHYFTLPGRSPFTHLVYPVPGPDGLGIHVTLDMGGQVRFGPDVSSWPDGIDYRFEDGLEAKFYRAIRRFYPALRDGALQHGYTGLRPKLAGPGAPSGDFLVRGGAREGLPQAIGLFGIESPGLTACLAIARHVQQRTRA